MQPPSCHFTDASQPDPEKVGNEIKYELQYYDGFAAQ